MKKQTKKKSGQEGGEYQHPAAVPIQFMHRLHAVSFQIEPVK
jgi:hypothetical protein